MSETKITISDKQKPEFHDVVSLLLGLMAISSGISSITKLVKSIISGQAVLGIICFVFEMANILFLVFVLNKKGWGIFAFFGMLLLLIPMNLIVGCEDMSTVYFSVAIRICIISLLLLIRKDGISAWSILLDDIRSSRKRVSRKIHNSRKTFPEPDRHKAEYSNDGELRIDYISKQELDSDEKAANLLQGYGLPVPRKTSQSIIPSWLLYLLSLFFIITCCFVIYNGRFTTIGESNTPYDKWKNEIIIPNNVGYINSGGKGEDDAQKPVRVKQLDTARILANRINDIPQRYIEEVYDENPLESLKRRQKSISALYSAIVEDGRIKSPGSLKDFASKLGNEQYRKQLFDITSRYYDNLGDYETYFKPHVYPSTEEHIKKEAYRRYIYESLEQSDVVTGDYSTFIKIICIDTDLKVFYDEGVRMGLKLGTFDEFRVCMQ